MKDKKEIIYKPLPFCEHCGGGYRVFGAQIRIGGIDWCPDCCEELTEKEYKEVYKKIHETYKEWLAKEFADNH